MKTSGFVRSQRYTLLGRRLKQQLKSFGRERIKLGTKKEQFIFIACGGGGGGGGECDGGGG